MGDIHRAKRGCLCPSSKLVVACIMHGTVPAAYSGTRGVTPQAAGLFGHKPADKVGGRSDVCDSVYLAHVMCKRLLHLPCV